MACKTKKAKAEMAEEIKAFAMPGDKTKIAVPVKAPQHWVTYEVRATTQDEVAKLVQFLGSLNSQ